MGLYAQQTITLTADLVLTETLLISEDVIYEGNGFSIICEGCEPAIRVTNEATAQFNDVRFPRVYDSWLKCDFGSRAIWDSPKMMGQISAGRGSGGER